VWLFNPWWGAVFGITALSWIFAAAKAPAKTPKPKTAVAAPKKKRGRGRPPKKK